MAGEDASAFLDHMIEALDISMRMNLCEEVASGSFDLDEDVVEDILDAVYRRHQDDLWFRVYEKATDAIRAEEELHRAETAVERLRLHFSNQGMSDDPRARKILEQLG